MQPMADGEILLAKVFLYPFFSVIAVTLIISSFARRYWLLWHGIKFVIVCALTFLVLLLAMAAGLKGWWVQYIAIGIAGPVFLFPLERFVPMPKGFRRHVERSRRIPSYIRKQVIQQFEAKGNKYDPKTHHIDHKFPFSKGGGHTMDNLRIVPKNVNQKKSGTEPTLAGWIRMWRGKD